MEKRYKRSMAEANERRVTYSVAEAMAYLNHEDMVWEDMQDQPARVRDGQIPGVAPTSRGMVASEVDAKRSSPTPVFTSKGKYLLDCASGGRSALAARSH